MRRANGLLSKAAVEIIVAARVPIGETGST
jgi:hypothetical protein